MPTEPIANLRATKHYTRDNHERKWLLVDAQGQRVEIDMLSRDL